ncbi:MAG: S8 family serine peptidase [Caldimonas sp.]
MQRRQFLGFMGAGSASLITGCCLPPVSSLSEEEAAKFAPKFTANTLLARIQIANASTAAVGTPRAMFATPAVAGLSGLLGSEYELLTIGGPGASAIGFVDGTQVAWLLVKTPAQPEGVTLTGSSNIWDLAHHQADTLRTRLQSKGFTGLDVRGVFVEPNLEQTNPYDRSWTCPLGGSSVGDAQINGSRNSAWPSAASGGLEWNLDDDRTQLRTASQATWDVQKTVRIAHLDTGFDPQQITLPVNLDEAAERNFLLNPSTAGPGSAVDPGKPKGFAGWGCFNSHGTGTLSLLAGRSVKTPPPFQADGPMGASPNAVVIPVRIADSVIHLYSASMGLGIFYAARPTADGGGGCDVISISAGGLPSQFWADAVNFAYENGVVIAAATGDNIHGLPTRGSVWPARFRRVIAVAGATSDNGPYDRDHSNDKTGWMMEGSYGPDHVMDHAVTAYAPNTPWAYWEASSPGGRHTKIDVDGGGTSASTPQVAGAAALYVAKHPELPNDWQRAETVRQALFQTAVLPRTTNNDHRYFGRGVLKANDALALTPAADTLKKESPDVICSPFLEAILDRQLCDFAEGQMLALELAQLLASDAKYEQLYPDWDAPTAPQLTGQTFVSTAAPTVKLLLADPRASLRLRVAIAGSATKFGIV